MTSNPYDVPPEPPPLDELDRSEPSPDDRNLALLAHLSGAAGLLGAGFLGFVGPLIIYLMKKDSSTFVADQAKEALNFQITLLLVAIGCAIVVGISCGLLFPLVFVPMVLQLVFAIIAALAAKDGTWYRYPFAIRLLQ